MKVHRRQLKTDKRIKRIAIRQTTRRQMTRLTSYRVILFLDKLVSLLSNTTKQKFVTFVRSYIRSVQSRFLRFVVVVARAAVEEAETIVRPLLLYRLPTSWSTSRSLHFW